MQLTPTPGRTPRPVPGRAESPARPVLTREQQQWEDLFALADLEIEEADLQWSQRRCTGQAGTDLGGWVTL
ncbi:hypothetical protein Strvi_0193 (plasmid) [Streptomyces violaceusniger Tu 4113]|uniref:Uncharacterized protein n=1 Tax=Streptomyces violaceusniger (strain Tu 4113) TaxID=653045 RepID=G2PI15_STRV4|nr:hypothetical protein Strvi_0193 [Streptomyces violaceusniger Tu 4113]